jgi:hypothetical protein
VALAAFVVIAFIAIANLDIGKRRSRRFRLSRDHCERPDGVPLGTLGQSTVALRCAAAARFDPDASDLRYHPGPVSSGFRAGLISTVIFHRRAGHLTISASRRRRRH